MMKRLQDRCARAPVGVLSLFLAVLMAGSLLIPPLLNEKKGGEAKAGEAGGPSLSKKKGGEAKGGETDSGTRQCEEDYAICRVRCDAGRNCLEGCLQTYNACRRNVNPR
jgi:hypothetical protein